MGINFVPTFPVAAHHDGTTSTGVDSAFVLALQWQHPANNLTISQMRVYRSTDKGQTWSKPTFLAAVEGYDGFIDRRDSRMTPYHVCCDPDTSVDRVYAFFVRNEVTPYLMGPPKLNFLYCVSSSDGGDHWGGERSVFALPYGSIPSSGFADVPTGNDTTGGGFYRIGRVWSCVDPSGNVYAVWSDNRYGLYSSGTHPRDYWHVFYAKSTDHGQTWGAPVRVSYPGSTVLADIKTNASIGGFGTPNVTQDWIPPGDFLSCDADDSNLYVAWPDSRACQSSNNNSDTKVYFSRIPQ